MPQSIARIGTEGALTLSLDEAINPYVKLGAAYWRSVCGRRRFPARADLTLRGMAAILPFAVILSVVDRGADFEYRYVGEAQRQAFKTSFKGLRVSQIEAAVPQLGSLLRNAYEHARALGTPFIIRGRVDHEPADSKLLYHESAFLPLGVSDAEVDHLLIVGVQIPEPFWDIPMDKLTTLADQSGAGVPSAASATAR
ncbi:MAG TPA: hypothetical protein VII56_06850 [Rhizomicrobium sp.]